MSRLRRSKAICCLVAATIAGMATCLRSANGASATGAAGLPSPQPDPLTTYLGVEFVKDSTSTVLLEREGKRYLVDLGNRTIREAEPLTAAHAASASPGALSATPRKNAPDGAVIFKQNCVMCHGPDGKGVAAMKTPDFTDPKVLASLTDQQMIDIITGGKGDGDARLGRQAFGGRYSSRPGLRSLSRFCQALHVRASVDREGERPIQSL